MNALVVGGSRGIGLSIVLTLVERENIDRVFVLDKQPVLSDFNNGKIQYIACDLSHCDIEIVLKQVDSIQALYITAGFGDLRYFQELTTSYIDDSFVVNVISPIRIIKYYYCQLLQSAPFHCGIMVSIAGRLSSPMFSVYSATKAALSKFIEAINIELEVQDSPNRVLEVSPGSLVGTSFTGGVSNPEQTKQLAAEIIAKTEAKETLFIPDYETIFKDVLKRYQMDAHQYGIDSYWYKQQKIRR